MYNLEYSELAPVNRAMSAFDSTLESYGFEITPEIREGLAFVLDELVLGGSDIASNFLDAIGTAARAASEAVPEEY